MVRHRGIPKNKEASSGDSAIRAKIKDGKRKHSHEGVSPKSVLGAICVVVSVCVVIYFVRIGYLETRVGAPLNVPTVIQDTPLDWGSYRPGVYFGMKTRSKANVLTGMMWMVPELMAPNDLGLRHWCEQGDGLSSFGWLQHDGENFGIQEILDRTVNLTTSFVKRKAGKHGGEWTSRIKAQQREGSNRNDTISLFYYVALDEGSTGQLRPIFSRENPDRLSGVIGRTPDLKDFKILFHESDNALFHFFSSTESPGPAQFTDTVKQRLRLFHQRTVGLDTNHLRSETPNIVVFQVIASLPFELDIAFISGSGDEGGFESRSAKPIVGEHYDQELDKWKQQFDKRFDATFHLREKGYKAKEIRFAQAAMSNLIGGIGYFYGHSLVKSDLTKSPIPYWDAPLYTAVPSRSFFPRGFLWDEGFHNLLISKWSPEISFEILGHWLDLMNYEGWIPREQILGMEARAKVPAEFVVQHNKNANPPTLLLTLHSLLRDLGDDIQPVHKGYLQRMWPRLVKWYDWFNVTQAGPEPGSYRWRGRNGTTDRELNPKTLTSGLDDFPRASHPTEDERHVDLLCWMALASKLMKDIAKIIGETEAEVKFSSSAAYLWNNENLDSLHWSELHGAYLDFGLHTDGVTLQRPRLPPAQPGQPPQPKPEKVRVVSKAPELQFVNNFGYISLFPFLLQLIEPTSPKLEKVLQDIEDPNRLFTKYGLRSIAKTAPMYMKRNTEHDPPYWRGPIWININFLAIRSLFHYSHVDGPYQSLAQRIYQKLQSAVVQNVMNEYYRTGYVWEQYNDQTGKGQGCRPFTGWSSLVVLMMGENY